MKASWGTAAGLHFLQIDPDFEPDRAPLVIALHGRGADPTDLAGLAYEISPERCRWVLPQGPVEVPLGPEIVGWAWYSRGLELRSMLLDSRDRLAGLLEEVAEPDAPEARIALIGFSQGAAMALHLGLTSPVALAGIAAMSGYLPAAETLDEIAQPKPPILMVHGTLDQVLAVDLAREARDRLARSGVATRYLEFPMGHEISLDSLAAVGAFLDEVLGLGSAA